MTDHEVAKIVPDGDVGLVCGGQTTGSKQLKIIVSSAILSLGSTVFNTMLGPRFKEGATLAKYSHVEVPLPEDDPKALLTLCKLLHLRDVEYEVQTPYHTLQLAILADKYNCFGALRMFYRMWIDKAWRMHNGPQAFDACVKYFAACFYMKLPDKFEQYGHRLMVIAEKDIKLTAAGDCAGPLESVADALSAQRTALINKIVDVVQEIIEQELDMSATQGTTHMCRHSCAYRLDRATAFGKWLFNSALWPLSSIHKRNLRCLERSLTNLASDWIGSASLCNGWDGKECYGLLLPGAYSLVAELAELSEEIRCTDVELCLECVRSGDFDDSTGCDKEH